MKKISISISFFFILGVVYASDTLNVKNYGAVGNGIQSDYNALMLAVQAMNTKGGGVLYFPEGNYYIAEFNTAEKTYSNIIVSNCSNISIIGKNAKITVNGNFTRKADFKKKKYTYSKTMPIIPLVIKDCQNVSMEGLEFDGQVNLLQNEKGVVEGPGRLIVITNSKNVVLKNIFVHHAMTDGIYIAGTSENVFGENIVSSNNGRQGMSIVGLNRGKFINCAFNNTGKTEGTFGGFSPRAGVDIEPVLENKVMDIIFEKCTFENNVGSQFVCSSPKNTTNVTVDNCIIRALTSRTPYQIILSVNNAVIMNSNIDCGVGSIYPIWNVKDCSSTLKNNLIKSKASGIVVVPKKDLNESVKIDGNRMEYYNDTILKKYFPYITSTNTEFINNTVIIPKKYQKEKGVNVLVGNSQNIERNNFQDEKGKKIENIK